jgi:hypothetical protein
MKKLLLLILLAASVAAQAQSPRWSMSVLGGAQLASEDVRSGASFALTADYAFTEHVALTGSLSSFEGELEHVLPSGTIPQHGSYVTDFNLKSRFYILSVGPKFYVPTGQNSKLFFSVLVGYTLGSTSGMEQAVLAYADGYREYYPSYGPAPVSGMRENKFTFGAAVGWRYYFGSSVGVELQASYDNYSSGFQRFLPMGSLKSGNYVAFRAGVTFRF